MCEKSDKKIVKAEILSNKEVCPGYFVLEAGSSYLGRVSLPGQFVNVKISERAFDPLLRIPLGIHDISPEGIKLLYKVVGEGTELLSRKSTGEQINILGPLGNGFDLAPALATGAEVFVVAGGHGIAPLYSLSRELRGKGVKIIFFTGINTKAHLTCKKELESISIEPLVASVDGSVGFQGNITELLELNIKERSPAEGIIYACGPRPMLKETARIAEENDVAAQVSMDAYMACGIGVCLGCAIRTLSGYKMVCKDGPVFAARDIIWEEVG